MPTAVEKNSGNLVLHFSTSKHSLVDCATLMSDSSDAAACRWLGGSRLQSTGYP